MEVETGKSDAIGKIKKCLNVGFASVFCLSIGKESTNRIRELVVNFGLDPGKVRVIEILRGIKTLESIYGDDFIAGTLDKTSQNGYNNSV